MPSVYSVDGKYRLTLPGDGVDGLLFGEDTSSNALETVYHYTAFSNSGTIETQGEVDLEGAITWTSISAKVTVSSFTLSYISDTTFSSYSTRQVVWVTGNTSVSTCRLTFGGEHQGVFQKNMWFVRNNEYDFKRNHSSTDPVDAYRGNYEVASEHITMVRSRAELAQLMPNGYYAGFKFTPDRTTQTSITWTVNLALTGSTSSSSKTTSITFTDITQTVRNNWDKFIKEVREFVYQGKEEGAGVTTYNQGGVLTRLYNPSFSVVNSTTAGSGATITVTFPLAHGAFAGNRIEVAVTSTGTNHGKASGVFNILTATDTSITYTCTSVGTVSTTTSLLASISFYKTTATINLPKF